MFNHDWTCRGFQYKVGKIYKHEGDISLCERGFHFCRKIDDCFSYYDFDPKNKVAEIEALGNVESDSDKSVTDKIKIVREISWEEMLRLANTLDTSCEQGVPIVWYDKYKCYIAIRKLTPKECFRLQGWTDEYFEKAEFVNSDSQLYKQAGNGVTVNVVYEIARAIGNAR